MMYPARSAFTLVEIAISIAVLFIGLAGTLSLYMVGMRWSNEIKVNLTAYDVAQAVARHPDLLPAIEAPVAPQPATPSDDDAEVRAWYMGYFVRRTIEDAGESVPGGRSLPMVRVRVFHGGDDSNGNLVVDIRAPQLVGN